MNRAFLRRQRRHEVTMAKVRKRDRELAQRRGASLQDQEPKGDDPRILAALLGRQTEAASP